MKHVTRWLRSLSARLRRTPVAGPAGVVIVRRRRRGRISLLWEA